MCFRCTAKWFSYTNQSILKEIIPEYSLEGLMLKLRLQYFGHLMQRAYLLEKNMMLGGIEDRRRRRQQSMRWLDDIKDSMDIGLRKLREIVKKRELAFRHKHFCLLGLHPWPTCCGGCSVTSRVQLFSTSWTVACQASLSFTIFQSLLKLMSIESVMPSKIVSSSVAPFSSCLQSFPTSGSFRRVSSSHQVAKILEFQLQHQSFQWIFRTDFL